jgi:crossover junction endonuclease EME1
MKPIEVIDLLSSPEPEVRKSKPVSNATPGRVASTLPFAKSVALSGFLGNRAKAGKDADEWLCISDDPDNDDPLPAPVVQKPMRHDDHMGNPPSRNLKSLDAKNRTSSTASGSKRVSPVEVDSAKAKGKGKAKGDDDFFFLSDDFNNNIDLNDRFESVLEPAAKRRRLTPEPASMKNTYSAMEKGKGISRSVSDITAGSRSSTMGTVKAANLRRSNTTILDDDPIVFSSSPDLVRVARDRNERLRRQKNFDMDNDDDDPFQTYERVSMASAITHHEHEDDLQPSSDLDLPDIGTIASQASSFSSLSRADSKKTLAAYNSEKLRIQKERDKARKAQEKLSLKEAEKERKRAAKETKAKEKEIAADLAKVNTLRIDKKVSTPAMIVDLPIDLDARLAGQVRQFLGPLEVECKEWSSSIPNIIKWRRKVDSIYNEDIGLWEPVPKQIKPEKHVMCVMVAKEFVDLAMGEEGHELDAHVLRMKAKFDGCAIIYLIEGLTVWMRKNRNVKNRQFTEAVRSQMSQELDASAASASQKAKKKKQQEYVDENMIEDALLRLQIIHGTQIHHTAAAVDTAQWVMVFTQHISTIPYR